MSYPSSFTLDKLFGQWHIVYSNFPMWTKGKRITPSLNYSLNKEDKIYFINDLVKFSKNGKSQSIKGYNMLESSAELKFKWKGKGILALLNSHWKIIHFTETWMIIHFDKTIFTPEGYDVVSKTIDLNPYTVKEIQNRLQELEIRDLLPIPH